MGANDQSMYQIHGDDAPSQPRASGRRVRLVAAVLLVVCASLGVGFGIGWEAKSSTTVSTGEASESYSKATTGTSDASSSTSTTPTPTPTTPTDGSTTPTRPRYVFVGDSITELGWSSGGFTDLLVTTFNDSIDVVNHGRSGYSTKSTLENTLPEITNELVATPQPVFIAVWLGNNDAAIVGGNYEHAHVPLDEFKANLGTILTTLRNSVPDAHLMLVTPSIIDDAKRRELLIERNQTYDPIDRSLEQAGLYAEACREVAAERESDNVSLLDIYSYFTTWYPDTSDYPLVLDDGLHYSKRGHREVFEQITLHILKRNPLAFVPV